ncbi:MAG: GGDEF domain-containing protein [Wenzhouxiangellaceae bacterium]|nr:GGDEF domain-containing protein [Wenzhouxiangellaceae bacterium]
MTESRHFERFESAVGATLDCLHRHGDFPVWTAGRVVDGCWVALQVRGDGLQIDPGTVCRWSRGALAVSIEHDGVIVARGPGEIPNYVDEVFAPVMPVASYACVPLRQHNGRLFGTLSGFGSEPFEGDVERVRSLLALLGTLLSGMTERACQVLDTERASERFRFETMTDALTHLPGRIAFFEKLERENLRCRRFGEHAFVSIVDIRELHRINKTCGRAAGDELLRRAALAIRYAVRDGDFVARLEGSTFAVLGIDCGPVEEHDVSERVRSVLARSGIRARVATALRGAGESLDETRESACARLRSVAELERIGGRSPGA